MSTISGIRTTQGIGTLTTFPSIIKNGIYLYYDYGNNTSYSGSGMSIHDLSGRNQTATASVSIPTFNSVGNLSNFQFTGSYSQYIDTSDKCTGLGASGAPGFTWNIVVKTGDNTARSSIMDKSGDGIPIGYDFEIGSGNTYPQFPGPGDQGTRMFFHDGMNSIDNYTNDTVSNNTIYLFTMRWDGITKTGTLFQNGTQISQETNAIIGSIDSSFSLQFGRGYKYGDGTFALTSTCNMYLNIVYSRPLSDDEVIFNYNVLKTRFGLS